MLLLFPIKHLYDGQSNHLYCIVLCTVTDKRSFSVLISDSYWDDYILIKHSTEIVCLLLQLMISTAMRRYDQTHNPRAKSQVRATNAVTK